jgi:hypothetical protein
MVNRLAKKTVICFYRISGMKGASMRSNARRFAFWIALTFLAALPAGAADVRYNVPAGDSPSIGPANAPVTIVEFLDYQ